jgi:autotransporter-associated beta strand protein
VASRAIFGVPATYGDPSKSYANAAGTSFTVTLGENISVAMLTVDAAYTGNGITISGGTENYELQFKGNSIIYAASDKPFIIDATITGSAGLRKDWQGLVIFTKNNTYTGGTTVTGNGFSLGGTLQIGNGTTTGTLGGGTVTIRSAATSQLSWTTLAFYRSDDITVDNRIAFSNNASGGTYTGGRITNDVRGGTLTLSGAQAIISDATGVYDVNDVTGSTAADMIISGGLENSGTLVKDGAGTLTITSVSTLHTGAVEIKNGIFLMNGSTSGQGSYTVAANATLGGTGSIGTNNQDVVFQSGARLAPGDSQQQESLTFALGTGSLDLAGAVGGDNTGALVFRLGGTSSSDSILLQSGLLKVGDGALDFNDFAFSTTEGFGEGVYTLITSAQSVVGSLGSQLSGQLGAGGAYVGTLGLVGGNLTLTVTATAIPEASSMVFVLGASFAGLLLNFRLLKRRREKR